MKEKEKCANENTVCCEVESDDDEKKDDCANDHEAIMGYFSDVPSE